MVIIVYLNLVISFTLTWAYIHTHSLGCMYELS